MSLLSSVSIADYAVQAMAGRCEVCRSWSRDRLCTACRTEFAAPMPRCRRCALPLPRSEPSCGECLRKAFAFTHCVTVADYAHPWDRLITGLKFNGRAELAIALASVLDQAVTRAMLVDDTLPSPDLLLPVPLSESRLRERGYNQAWELARHLARRRRLAARPDLLLRWRDTTHQTHLNVAERERNLRQAFVADPRRAQMLRGKDLALVDDVVTTGATAAACSAELMAAGAQSVQLWTVARTPPPRT
jgi:ComF family protein